MPFPCPPRDESDSGCSFNLSIISREEISPLYCIHLPFPAPRQVRSARYETCRAHRGVEANGVGIAESHATTRVRTVLARSSIPARSPRSASDSSMMCSLSEKRKVGKEGYCGWVFSPFDESSPSVGAGSAGVAVADEPAAPQRFAKLDDAIFGFVRSVPRGGIVWASETPNGMKAHLTLWQVDVKDVLGLRLFQIESPSPSHAAVVMSRSLASRFKNSPLRQ